MNRAAELPITLGTAGHVDHGKTALIGALTGRNTDRLAEERRRGLSIELGFAELPLPGGGRVSVVDVPGHERFVRTMVAGASGVDLFLMVVAADDGPMPQTEEHWTILQALEVRRGVVALTKCDLVGPERRHEAARAAASLMPAFPIVGVSARTGEGIEELRAAIEAATATVISRAESEWPDDDPLLHVDRVFTLKGIGTVVTGTLWGGEVAEGDTLTVVPAGQKARVRRVHVHDQEVPVAAAGQRVALNLAGIDRRRVGRGDVVTSQDAGIEHTYRLDVRLGRRDLAESISRTRVHVHHGTREAPARVVMLEPRKGIVQLRLEAPLIVRAGDRVVLRSIAPLGTLGGGEVLDAHPRRHGVAAAAEPLRLIHAEPEAVLPAVIEERQDGLPASPDRWRAEPVLGAALRHHSRQRWEQALSTLITQGKARVDRGRVVGCAPRERATAGSEKDAPSRMPCEAAAQVLAALGEDGAEPRPLGELADAMGMPDDELRARIDELRVAGLVTVVRPGVVYASKALAGAVERTKVLISERGSVTLADVRDDLRTSRKYAQALLEHMDGQHLTIRDGDTRRLRASAVKARG